MKGSHIFAQHCLVKYSICEQNIIKFSIEQFMKFNFSGPKKPVVLRASQLESVTGSPVSSSTAENANSSFALSPAKLNNPFVKAGE